FRRTQSKEIRAANTRRPGSADQADAALEIPKSAVTTERIQAGPEEDAGIESLGKTFLEPGHRSFVVAERGVDDSDLGGARKTRSRTSFEIVEQPCGVALSSRNRERTREIGRERRAAGRQLHCLSQLGNRVVVLAAFEVREGELIVSERKTRIHFDRLDA